MGEGWATKVDDGLVEVRMMGWIGNQKVGWIMSSYRGMD